MPLTGFLKTSNFQCIYDGFYIFIFFIILYKKYPFGTVLLDEKIYKCISFLSAEIMN